MELEHAIQRMEWRFFSSFKNIFINDNDREAISTILDFIKNKRDHYVLNNELFSKIYIAHLDYLIKHYRAGVTDPIPFKKLHSTISRPLDNIIQDLVDTLNELEQNRLLTSSGCDKITHPKQLTNLEKEIIMGKMKNLLKIDSNRRKLFGQAWSFQEVKEGIMKQIKYVLDAQ